MKIICLTGFLTGKTKLKWGRIMQLTLFLMVGFLLTASANSYSQSTRLDINLKNGTVNELIKFVEDNSEFVFLYKDEDLDLRKEITVSLEEATIDQVLVAALNDQNLEWDVYDRQIVLRKNIDLKDGKQSSQQQRNVTGTVTDKRGEPLPGVTVLVQGTAIGTVTDENGEFSLSIPDDAENLQFSFVGMRTQAIAVDGQTTFTVMMDEDVVGMDEIIVVGYGTQKKSDITGTVASLSQERLEMVPNLNVAQAIQGAIPGVLIQQTSAGADPNHTILIRGRNSITANNDPLIIVDGIPYGGSLNDIVPNDIQSIEVLKDASAAAIYGSRGANGVILITTKEGKSGKTVVSYEGKYGISDVTKVNRMLTGPEFYEFKMKRNAAAMTLSEEEVYQDGTWTNWTELATRMGQMQEHNVSVSGGSEKTKYYIGGSFIDIKSVAKNDDFQRISTRLNLETHIREWLALGTRTQFTADDASGSEANFETSLETNPLSHAYDEFGNLTIFPWPDNIIVGNPLGPLLYDDLNKSYQVVSNNYVNVEIPFIRGLNYRLNTGVRFRFTDRANYQPRTTQSGIADLGDGSIDNSVSNNITIENILSYNRDFGKHTFFATALYSYEGNKSRTNSVDATKYPNDFLSWYASGQATNRELSNFYTNTALVSQMFRLNYSYDSRYLLTLTLRRDGYSGFGADNKWGIFPSAALGWNLANEEFFAWKNTFNEFKIRGSYGINGNQAINPYQSLSQYVVANISAGPETLIGYKPGRLGVSDLGWESSQTLNIGLDFGILESRISGSVNWYQTKTSDLLLERSISVIHGVTPVTHLDGTGMGYGNGWIHPGVTQNIGKTQNSGVELFINSRNIVKGKFYWSTSGNLSFNQNKIISLYGELDEEGNEIDDISNGWFINQPIRLNYDYVWDGVWQLNEADEAAKYGSQPGYVKLKDTDGNGVLNADDRQIIGQLDPKIIGGMTNTFSYGNLTLSIFIHGVYGITVENYLMNDNVQGAEVRYNTLKKNWWTPENPTNDWVENSLLANNMSGQSGTIYENPDFIRVKDISLSYDIPVGIMNKVGFSKLKLYATGRNLFTYTKWTGMDPDLHDEDSQQGIPMQKEYVFGLVLGF